MALRMPDLKLALVILASNALFLAVAAWGWGSWSGLFGHPARLVACLAVVLASLAALFSGATVGDATRADARTRWIILVGLVLTLAMAGAPAYTDARDIATLDGEVTRFLGLTLFIIGLVLRVGPMFVLGGRFRAPWSTQQDHRLVTTGLYRYIRNPSYLGAILAMAGWALVFRCGFFLIPLLLLVPPGTAMAVRAEEALLLAEFGDEYAAYKRRTWRLVPFIY